MKCKFFKKIYNIQPNNKINFRKNKQRLKVFTIDELIT